MKNVFAILFIGLCAISCGQKDCCGFEEEGPGTVTTGSWLLYEKGYSPGSGYIIEPVPEDPPQIMTFHSNQTMSSSIQGFESYHYYTFAEGASPEVYVVSFYKVDPATVPVPIGSAYVNNATFQNNTLTLSNPGCIEGCHLALRRID